MISGEELNRMLKENIAKIKRLGIPLSKSISPEVIINIRAKRRLGCCIYKDRANYIEVSSILLEDTSVSTKMTNHELLEQTICHELLHTCRGCKNHGDEWKAYAEILNRAYGYNIERTISMDALTESSERLRMDKIKYILLCQSCGLEIKRSRMSKPVKYPNRYRCRCGGKLKRIK